MITAIRRSAPAADTVGGNEVTQSDNTAKIDVSGRFVLDSADKARIEELVPRGPARGDRYPAQFMAELDSER